jgi:hypothetical protein
MFAQSRSAPFVLSIAILLLCATPSSAHETKTVGSLRLTIGWNDEPAYTGIKNAIEVAVSDAAGAPIADAAESFVVEASFGDQRVGLTLQPVHGRPGLFRAWLLPTRSGTYAFRFTGRVRGQAIDITSACSPTTFSCVSDVSELQFPVKDPSIGQLSERVNRTLPRAQQAIDAAARSQVLALGAIAAAAVALAVIWRKGRTGR